MTREELAIIIGDRLEQWHESCVDAHATPALLVAIGHDHAAGEVNVLTVQDITNDELRLLLAAALARLPRGNGVRV